MDTFFHIRMLMSIIMGLSITHLLKGATKLIEHPKKYKPYWVHLLWALYVFLLLIYFWWFEIHLKEVKQWVFTEYVFIIGYIILYYILCALLFPDDLNDYEGYEDYFYSRKKWFFGVLAMIFAADVLDTYIKGRDYLAHLHWEYPVRNVVHILLCVVAIRVSNKKFHAILVILFLLYQLSWILRFYNT